MEAIKLNDLLNIDEKSDDFLNGRITLNTSYDGVKHLDTWLQMKENERECGPDFSFWAKNSTGSKQHLHENDLVVVAIQMYSRDTWLLASICRVTKVHFDKPCERVAEEKYRKWFNRVIFKLSKNAQGYNFKLHTFLDRCDVIEILPKPYSGIPFPGYFNLNEKMRTLMHYIDDTNLGEDWKNALKAVKAVYCLNNHDENKVYIGSAYNDNGCLLKRWKDYFDSLHGYNVELKSLFEKHKGDKDYFLDNFYFSILEILPTSVSDEEVIKREHHWMDVFNSRDSKCGYNKN